MTPCVLTICQDYTCLEASYMFQVSCKLPCPHHCGPILHWMICLSSVSLRITDQAYQFGPEFQTRVEWRAVL